VSVRPPARVLTLLFSDVENSTQLAERVGEVRARKLWKAHDRAARDLLASHDGREMGRADGMLLLFETAAQAVRFALDYQAAVVALGMPLRIGIHSGAVTLRENTPADVARGAAPIEVEGLAVSITSRLMALARGGQTLLSAATREALGVALPGRVSLECHGHYRVKGIDAPLEIHEVGVRGEAAFLPPPDVAKAYRVARDGDLWLPVREVRHNLSAERDAFVGRAIELRALGSRLADGARLVTILGPGGIGKTRLVRRYAWTWLGDWPGGVCFCDLSDARSLDGMLFAAATALGVPLGREDPVAHLGRAIAGRGRSLMILDNFEQVVGQAPATVGRWLDAAPEASFVVTSRERLQVAGEEAFLIDPLPLDTDAIELFERRACAQDPGFSSHDGGDAVAALVRLLDGLPLAIELAAARVRLLTPAALLARVRERFALLAKRQGAEGRHATLQATIDWSWQLLAPWEQAAFAQCSTFDGGFTLEAAEAVLDLRAWPDSPLAMDVVQALCDKSLLRTWIPVDSRGGRAAAPLLGMYLSIHDYAVRKLAQEGDVSRRPVEERHVAHYAGFGTEKAIEALSRAGGIERRRELARALDNLVTACRRALERGAARHAADTFIAASAVLELQGPTGLIVALGAQVLGLDGLSAVARTRALFPYGTALRRSGRAAEAEQALQQALDLTRAQENARLEARVLMEFGSLRQGQGRFAESRACAEDALRIARAAGDRRIEGGVENNLGIVDALQGRLAQARARFEAALAIHREVEDRQGEGVDTVNLANTLRLQDHPDEAIAHFERALLIHREVGDRRNEGLALGTLGVLHCQQGRVDEALALLERALAIHREVGNRHAEGADLAAVGELMARRGRIDEAREALRRGERLLRDVGDQEGLATLLCERGGVEIATGDRAAACATLEEAESILVALGIGGDSEPGLKSLALRRRLGV